MSLPKAERTASAAAATRSAKPGKADAGLGDRYGIRVLDRAFALLEVLADGQPRNLVQLNAEAGLITSTTFRLLASLQSHNYVSRDLQTGRYSLGPSCLELAHAFLGNTVRYLAAPHLLKLREETQETVHLAVLSRMDVVYIDKLDGSYAIGVMSSQIGGRKPAYCTGVGKALLAHQDPEAVRQHYEQAGMPQLTSTTISTVEGLLTELGNIRARGYALDLGENEAEVRCVAVPIFDAAGQPAVALSVSGPAMRMDPVGDNTQLISRAVNTAGLISNALGHRPDADGRRVGG